MASETKVKVSTIISIVGCVGALLGIGAYLFSFGERIGRIETTLTSLATEHAKTSTAVGTAKDKASADVLKLAESTRGRLREHERVMGQLSETLVALTTEVRIRDRAPGAFTTRLPARVQETAAASKVDSKLKAVKLTHISDDPLAGLSF